ncbi:ABC transporter substrate-binding protein, partial [Candidatus Poribacteria bacterium]|nr:ABC transporter substrate-binding protein [Candidatus Poribacteria bacterium]
MKIRDGVTWADGEAFDADDIVFTIQTLLNDETQSLSDAANIQQWVDSIERIDGLTIQFNLKSPNPRFQLDHFSVKVWGGPIILPQHIWQGKDPFTFTFYNREKGWPFGTGAYKLVQATENEFTYDRRDTWWGNETGFMEMPVPKRLVWIVSGAEENTSFLAADGQLDSIMDITLGAFEAIQDMNPNIIAWQDQLPYAWPDPCPRQMSINHTVEPWNDPDMRRALSLMIDRQQVVEIAYEGTSSPTKTLFVEYVGMTPYINGLKDLWISPTADLIAGRALIEANGWVRNASGFYQKDGQELSLDIQTHEGFIEMRR